MLTNIKNAPKTVYQSTLEAYLVSGITLVRDQVAKVK